MLCSCVALLAAQTSDDLDEKSEKVTEKRKPPKLDINRPLNSDVLKESS